MTPSQRQEILSLLRLTEQLPEHGLQPEGVAYVSGTVRRQRISYTVVDEVGNPKRLEAWLLRPSGGNGPWPGIIALHPHGDRFHLGGDEVAGQCGQREHHYGAYLASRGFVVLCPDLPCFGQQQAPDTMPQEHRWEEHCLSRALAHGRSLLAETMDQLRGAVSALLDYEKTAGLEVGVIGYGMGARTAAWLAFIDQRIGSVWMHSGLGQQRLLLTNGRLLPRHNLLPGLLALGLDQADIVASILPRPLGISFGRHDRVALPEAVSPVLEAVRSRAALFPTTKTAILEGDYDHRFPLEVQQQIADHLLAWVR
jgi:dienelactone hydrolase